jgi:hypothetical protein
MPRVSRKSLMAMEEEERQQFLAGLSKTQADRVRWHWDVWSRPQQRAPEGDWQTWLLLAGRGFGKTRAGAEWVREMARRHPEARIALIASSLGEARRVMVEGESGLLAIARPEQRPLYESSLRKLTWPNEAQAQKEVFVNEALVRIDALLHARVGGIASSPPTSPVDGNCWIVGANPLAEWAGEAASIACRAAGNWLFVAPLNGMSVTLGTSGQIMRYRSGQWSIPAAVSAPQGRVTIDSQARTAISDLLARLVEAGLLPSA